MMMQQFGLGLGRLLGLCPVTYADGRIQGVSIDALGSHIVQLAHLERCNPQQQIITSTLRNMSGQYQPAASYPWSSDHADHPEFEHSIMLNRADRELLARMLPPLSPTAEHSVYEQLQPHPASP